MNYLLVFGLTLVSCLIFERLDLLSLVRQLSASYKKQFAVMNDKSIDDEEKQKIMMGQTGKQFGLIGKLIVCILLFISPFIAYVLLDPYIVEINSSVLYTLKGIAISLLAVLVYIGLKKLYVLFRKR